MYISRTGVASLRVELARCPRSEFIACVRALLCAPASARARLNARSTRMPRYGETKRRGEWLRFQRGDGRGQERVQALALQRILFGAIEIGDEISAESRRVAGRIGSAASARSSCVRLLPIAIEFAAARSAIKFRRVIDSALSRGARGAFAARLRRAH